jgi:hypothetical protein
MPWRPPQHRPAYADPAKQRRDRDERRVADAVLAPTLAPLRLAEFHSLVIDIHKLKDKVYNAGSREVGFNKEIYQLCQKFGRINRSYIPCISRQARHEIFRPELRDILNFGIMAKQIRDRPYRRDHFRD